MALHTAGAEATGAEIQKQLVLAEGRDVEVQVAIAVHVARRAAHAVAVEVEPGCIGHVDETRRVAAGVVSKQA